MGIYLKHTPFLLEECRALTEQLPPRDKLHYITNMPVVALLPLKLFWQLSPADRQPALFLVFKLSPSSFSPKMGCRGFGAVCRGTEMPRFKQRKMVGSRLDKAEKARGKYASVQVLLGAQVGMAHRSPQLHMQLRPQPMHNTRCIIVDNNDDDIFKYHINIVYFRQFKNTAGQGVGSGTQEHFMEQGHEREHQNQNRVYVGQSSNRLFND